MNDPNPQKQEPFSPHAPEDILLALHAWLFELNPLGSEDMRVRWFEDQSKGPISLRHVRVKVLAETPDGFRLELRDFDSRAPDVLMLRTAFAKRKDGVWNFVLESDEPYDI